MSVPTNPVENPYATPAATMDPTHIAAALPHDAQLRELFDRGKNGAGWFYWVACLSAVNTVAVVFNGGLRFALGLVVTMFGDAVAARSLQRGDMTTLAIALGFNAFVLGLFIICGRLSQRRN